MPANFDGSVDTPEELKKVATKLTTIPETQIQIIQEVTEQPSETQLQINEEVTEQPSDTQSESEKSWDEVVNTAYQNSLPPDENVPDWAKVNNRKQQKQDRREANKTEVLYIGNLDNQVEVQEVRELFGLNSTVYLRENTWVYKQYEPNGRFAGYFKLEGPLHILKEVLKGEGMKYKNRTLDITFFSEKKGLEKNGNFICKPYTPYGGLSYRGKGSRKGGNSRYYPGRGRTSYGAPTRQPNNYRQAPPRQGTEKAGPLTQVRGEPGNTTHRTEETVNSANRRGEENLTMAEHLTRSAERTEAAEKEKRQVIFEITCNEEPSLENTPDAALVYEVLQDEFATDFNLQPDMVQAIFTPEPTNWWRWSVIFDSSTTKQHFERKEKQCIRSRGGQEITYQIRTAGAPQRLLVTVQSSPLILDSELTNNLEIYGSVKGIQRQTYHFNRRIDSGLRKIFLLLHDEVEARDLPGFITTSDGVRRKLFFQGRLFYCRKCGSRHTYHEGCQPTHEDNGNPSISTEQPRMVMQDPKETVSEPQQDATREPEKANSVRPDGAQKQSTARSDDEEKQQESEGTPEGVQTPSCQENLQQPSAPEQRDPASTPTEEGGGDQTPAANKTKENSPDILPPTPTENPTRGDKGSTTKTRVTTNKNTGNLRGKSGGPSSTGIARVRSKGK